ncbi:hypothetical protein QE441_002079 [Chryseobacterium sp. SORGH_AS909]|uniref:Uncharacterized protein n=1 Tax=Chryseobacterium camelliae TaxID=1265445 RepID=A0ABU0TDD1_9FLAO|nr:hypothetical protein [Chryseobacterium camelliae]MDQ1098937.1 hypothetical protein [Chryseobacterium sp. SORGH_AS_1048]MDR6086285.1 hypothetical protein [Chryseobacterium sp. SORGH_AS_0909]MDR6130657.1 hypothetical protein [Chryseobacterium sp. SORGH_AS_1175]MDT3407212.1 hypothetical protein [Pseudacidovorax intermedius]
MRIGQEQFMMILSNNAYHMNMRQLRKIETDLKVSLHNIEKVTF